MSIPPRRLAEPIGAPLTTRVTGGSLEHGALALAERNPGEVPQEFPPKFDP
jgi:hypothetical protein